MSDALESFLDDQGAAAVAALRERLAAAGVAGVESHRPSVTLALAATIPKRTRDALRRELALLAVPSLWLPTLAIATAPQTALLLTAVVDTELLAVHTAVHDVLAGAVRSPAARHLPGSWVPHCTLAQHLAPAALSTAVAAVHPVTPIRAGVAAIGITDSRTGDVEMLR